MMLDHISELPTDDIMKGNKSRIIGHYRAAFVGKLTEVALNLTQTTIQPNRR
jgi:hypothetical protein